MKYLYPANTKIDKSVYTEEFMRGPTQFTRLSGVGANTTFQENVFEKSSEDLYFLTGVRRVREILPSVDKKFWSYGEAQQTVENEELVISYPNPVFKRDRCIETRRNEINAARDSLFYGDFDYEGCIFELNKDSRAKIQEMVDGINMGIITESFTWRDKNNEDHTFTPVEFQTAYARMFGWAMNVWSTVAWAAKDGLESLTDEELQAYDAKTDPGWPDPSYSGT